MDKKSKTEGTRTVTRITLSDLPDAEPTKQIVLPPKVAPIAKAKAAPAPIEKPNPREVVEKVTFERSFIHLYFYKMFSFLFVMVSIEAVIHGLKYLDGVAVLDPTSFTSFFFGSYTQLNPLKIMVMIFVIYLMTPYEKLVVSKKGLVANKVEITYLFFTTQRIFLSWEEIAKVEYHLRFFEPYLFFFDKEGKVLGQMDFSLSRPQDFFTFVEKNVSKAHPVMVARKGPSL